MITMNFFEGLIRILRPQHDRNDIGLRTWAKLEYKKDAEYAYNYFKDTGKIPGSAA